MITRTRRPNAGNGEYIQVCTTRNGEETNKDILGAVIQYVMTQCGLAAEQKIWRKRRTDH